MNINIGNYYRVELSNHPDRYLICKVKSQADSDRWFSDGVSCMNGRDWEFFTNAPIWFTEGRSVLLASVEEMKWLNDCMEAEVFIPFESINKKQEIIIW